MDIAITQPLLLRRIKNGLFVGLSRHTESSPKKRLQTREIRGNYIIDLDTFNIYRTRTMNESNLCVLSWEYQEESDGCVGSHSKHK